MFAMPSRSRSPRATRCSELQRILGRGKPNPRQKQHRTRNFRPCLEQLEERRLLYAGMLDHAFGTDGMAAIDLSGGLVTGGAQVTANAVALQADGKIVVAGDVTANPEADHSFLVARLNSDGSLDSSFNSNGATPGTVQFQVPTSFVNKATGVAIQSDGKIVIVGDDDFGLGVFRLNANGT